MKVRKFLFVPILILGLSSMKAQQSNLTLKDAVSIAVTKSNEVDLANTKAATRGYELQSVKDNVYPDLKVSGQYMRLANADVKLKSSDEATDDPDADKKESPKVNQLLLGQANLTMPIFAGFKLRNSIKASVNQYKAETSNAGYSKEETAMQVVEYYADLYKAEKSVELYRQSLKSSQQRVTDFTAKEQNGVIARNDLLKSQLQVSRIQLSLADAEKNVRLINYYLITLLKLSPDTQILVTPESIGTTDLFSFNAKTEAEALLGRKDLEALRYLENAGKANVKIAQSSYYPAFSFTGGYIALDLQNVVRVENAANFGLGFGYDLSSLFKTAKDVKIAKSRMLEVQQQQAILTDRIKAQIVEARENYDLSVKQQQVYTEAVTQSDENYRIVKNKYDNGLSDTNDLLDADVEDLTAKINQAYANANVVLKYYELLEATGQLTESFNLTKN